MAPSTAPPPALPPSMEAAYRSKCIQLKTRLNEVEESNDASRLRLVRIQRGIEKLRLERAFLLEQLAKRTSTNVEDSEGSPSPPPTPKEKPLRTKRGHRKPSFLNELGDGRAGSTFIPQNPVTMSPSSDAFSHTHPEPNSLPSGPLRRFPGASNGFSNPSPNPKDKRPKTVFDFFVEEQTDDITNRLKNGNDFPIEIKDIHGALAYVWTQLGQEGQAKWQQQYEQRKVIWEAEKLAGPATAPSRQNTGDQRFPAIAGDEDTEMGDDAESHSGGDAGGFTAVNRP